MSVGTSKLHDSAVKHVTGQAIYTDDIPEPAGALVGYLAQSKWAHAKILSMDLLEVKAHPGVVAVYGADDIPGVNDVGPVLKGDIIFADRLVEYAGQALFLVVAGDIKTARVAAAKARIEVEELPALITIEEALAADSHLLPTTVMKRGDAGAGLSASPHVLKGRIALGGQDHFYLEGQVSFAIPGEDGAVLVHCSTQHPSEVQHLVARALAIPDALVTVEVRRMGGGFGGKETQASLFAAAAALAATKLKRAVKIRLDRDDDMVMTGKRHDFLIDYEVGVGHDGVIRGLKMMLASRCGFSADLSGAINDRALFHADNCYFLEHIEVVSHRLKTHTVSNTAFRGFGGPQGMFAIEVVVDEIARRLAMDPLDVRRANLYGPAPRDTTPYGQVVEDNIAPEVIEELAAWADYDARRAAIDVFNANSPVLKKGIALTPVKFGISFTTTFLNQAGALIHIYTDGSIHLNHGGTEMGQGLFIKVAQVVATEFGVPLDQVRITATTTDKVPNTSATAASSGADLNGKAAQAAAVELRGRLAEVAAGEFKVPVEAIRFQDGRVFGGETSMSFGELAKKAHFNRVSLSATGYYRTPKIWFDRATFSGRPFYYFAYGAAVAEVLVDTLTGEYKMTRADLLHDVGDSLNPAIDLGQVEGAFIQGAGWLTSEELVFDGKGHLRTHAPSTYKIPTAGDIPPVFNVRLVQNRPNREETIYRSKAVGEPPFMLGIAVYQALRDAVGSVAADGRLPRFDAPATPERVLMAVEAVRTALPLSEPAMAAQ